MSAPVDSSSDDDEEALPPVYRQQPPSGSPGLEGGPNDILGGLNPWSIAKMNAPRNDGGLGTLLTAGRPPGSLVHEAQPGKAVWESHQDTNGHLDETGLSPGDMDLPAGRTAVLGPFQDASDRMAEGPYCSRLSSPAREALRARPVALPLVRDTAQRYVELGTPPSSVTRTQRRGRNSSKVLSQPALDSHARQKNPGSDDFRQLKLFPAATRGITNHSEGTSLFDEDISLCRAETKRPAVARNLSDHQGHPLRVRRGGLSTPGDLSLGSSGARGTRGDGPTWLQVAARRGEAASVAAEPDSVEGHEDNAPARTGLNEGDSRSYLMRRQKSVERRDKSGRPSLKRMKTDMLPLETTARQCQTQDAVQLLRIGSEAISYAASYLSWFDRYICTGTAEKGIDMSLGMTDLEEIENRLRKLLVQWTGEDDGGVEELRVGLQRCLKGKRVDI